MIIKLVEGQARMEAKLDGFSTALIDQAGDIRELKERCVETDAELNMLKIAVAEARARAIAYSTAIGFAVTLAGLAVNFLTN